MQCVHLFSFPGSEVGSMDTDEPELCPVCNTGYLEQVGDVSGHLACNVCFAQSQVRPQTWLPIDNINRCAI